MRFSRKKIYASVPLARGPCVAFSEGLQLSGWSKTGAGCVGRMTSTHIPNLYVGRACARFKSSAGLAADWVLVGGLETNL
jgi:hypothetical protein